MPTYMVRRHYEREDLDTEVIMTGLSREAAKAHCENSESHSRTATSRVAQEGTKRFGEWFDTFTEEMGPAEKTEYLRREFLGENHPDIYNRAVELASRGNTNELTVFIVQVLRAARLGSAMYAVGQALTDADLAEIDWEAIRESLID